MTFEEYLNKTYSDKVAKGYKKDFYDLMTYIKDNNLIDIEMNETDVRGYIQSLRKSGFANSTVIKKISSIRKYFKWLRNEGKMLHNPMDNISEPRVHTENIKVSTEHLKLITEKLEENKNIRDTVIFQLLISEGISPNEMIKITFKDFDLEKGMLYLSKKAITLSDATIEFVKILREERKDGFLLTNQHGHPLKESGIYFVINNYISELKQFGIKPLHLIQHKNRISS